VTAPSREELREHLVRTRIAGPVATPRASNVGNIRKMLARDPDYWFGVELDRDWSFEEIVAVMADRVGMDPDPTRESGSDVIDPDRCLEALDAMGDHLAKLAAGGGLALFATGHPTGLLTMLMKIADSLSRAGVTVITPSPEAWVSVHGTQRRIRYLGSVATIGTGGDLLHTHSPEPMQAILAGLERRDEPMPDLVIADHGWAGAAGQAGLPTVGFADTNDPALFVAATEGKLAVAVPLDDNLAPASYEPLAAYALRSLPGRG
jgi:hypothetical protein